MPEEEQQQEQAEQVEEPQAGTETAKTEEKAPAPPWGSDDEFDPAKAWKLIQNLRSEKEQLKPLADKAKELEDAQKTEQERLTEKLSATEKRAVEAELKAARLEVATEKGLPRSSVKFLTGTTPEELAESADELLTMLSSAGEDPVVPVTRRQGGDGGTPSQSPEDLADAVMKRQRGY